MWLPEPVCVAGSTSLHVRGQQCQFVCVASGTIFVWVVAPGIEHPGQFWEDQDVILNGCCKANEVKVAIN